MNIEDLEHIFKPQLDEGTTKLYFMLVDEAETPKQTMTVMRQDAENLAELLPMLSSFQYSGTNGRIPKFVK